MSCLSWNEMEMSRSFFSSPQKDLGKVVMQEAGPMRERSMNVCLTEKSLCICNSCTFFKKLKFHI